jgi:hypothetical protein
MYSLLFSRIISQCFFSTLKIIHAHLYSHADTTPAQNVKVKNDMHKKYKDGSSQKYAEKDRRPSISDERRYKDDKETKAGHQR